MWGSEIKSELPDCQSSDVTTAPPLPQFTVSKLQSENEGIALKNNQSQLLKSINCCSLKNKKWEKKREKENVM